MKAIETYDDFLKASVMPATFGTDFIDDPETIEDLYFDKVAIFMQQLAKENCRINKKIPYSQVGLCVQGVSACIVSAICGVIGALPQFTGAFLHKYHQQKMYKKVEMNRQVLADFKFVFVEAVEAVQNWTEERELLLREACSTLYEDQEKYWRDAFFRMYHSLDEASQRASRLKSYLLD